MPRKSAAALAVVPPVLSSRLSPPAYLGDRERALFIDIVLALPASHFQPSDLPLLCRYVEVTALAERAALALRGDVVVAGEPSPWLSIYTAMIKASIGLSLKLRLNPQARAPNTPRRPMAVSYYERQELEGPR